MNNVTIEQQIEMGIRKQNSKSVPAVESTSLASRQAAPVRFEMNVTPHATSHVEMKIDSQDRAWGFLIASAPRTFAFALGATLVAIASTGISATGAIALMFLIFSVAEITSYIYTLAISAEGTAHFEARQKWGVLRREQDERWRHYRGGD